MNRKEDVIHEGKCWEKGNQLSNIINGLWYSYIPSIKEDNDGSDFNNVVIDVYTCEEKETNPIFVSVNEMATSFIQPDAGTKCGYDKEIYPTSLVNIEAVEAFGTYPEPSIIDNFSSSSALLSRKTEKDSSTKRYKRNAIDPTITRFIGIHSRVLEYKNVPKSSISIIS